MRLEKWIMSGNFKGLFEVGVDRFLIRLVSMVVFF